MKYLVVLNSSVFLTLLAALLKKMCRESCNIRRSSRLAGACKRQSIRAISLSVHPNDHIGNVYSTTGSFAGEIDQQFVVSLNPLASASLSSLISDGNDLVLDRLRFAFAIRRLQRRIRGRFRRISELRHFVALRLQLLCRIRNRTKAAITIQRKLFPKIKQSKWTDVTLQSC